MNNMKPGKKLFYTSKVHLYNFHEIFLGNQALLALLEHTSNDLDVIQNECNAANELLMEILNDRFFYLFFISISIYTNVFLVSSSLIFLIFCCFLDNDSHSFFLKARF